MIKIAAIPGSSTKWHTPGTADIRSAEAAISALSDQLADARVMGWLDPPRLRTHWDAGWRELIIHVDDADLWSPSVRRPAPAIVWRWGLLWDNGDWYEIGWHPDDTYYRLRPAAAQCLWRALNPGKGVPPGGRKNPVIRR